MLVLESSCVGFWSSWSSLKQPCCQHWFQFSIHKAYGTAKPVSSAHPAPVGVELPRAFPVAKLQVTLLATAMGKHFFWDA